MERILQEIEVALNNGLYMLALQASATLPDICGALMGETGRATRDSYKSWYNDFAQPELNIWLNADDCYLFRCSMTHQGKTIPSPRGTQEASYVRVIFTLPNTQNISLHNNIFDGALNLDITLFCTGMVCAVRKWQALMQRTENANYRQNYSNLVRLYPYGLSPYIGGLPLIT